MGNPKYIHLLNSRIGVIVLTKISFLAIMSVHLIILIRSRKISCPKIRKTNKYLIRAIMKITPYNRRMPVQ
jgi:hypothetical protein